MSDTVLRVQGVSKRFGGLQASSDVGITIQAGQVYGLIGPNGAGKTTFFNVITGLYTPDSGTFDFFVEEIMGKDGDLRGDYLPSQDYNTLVNGVVYDVGGIAVLGYAYYDQNRDVLKALEVDAGAGCVAPTPAATPASSPAARSSASASPARWRCSPRSWPSTSRSPRWTSPSRPGSSICCWICSASSTCPISSSLMTCRWSNTWPTRWR